MLRSISPAIFLLLAISFRSSVAHDFSICSGVTDKLGINAVSLSPDPVKGGVPLTVKVSGGPTSVEVTGGTATLSVTLFGSKILQLPFDLCTKFGVTCPVQQGEKWNGVISYPIPKALPSFGSITAQVDITDTNGKELSCFTMKINLGDEQSWVEIMYRRLASIKAFLVGPWN